MALKILLAGRSKQELESLEQLLNRQPGVMLSTHPISNGHNDPLDGINVKPDLLVLDLSQRWQEELKAVAERPPSKRPPVLVIGPANDIQVMRKAMQAGARDFLSRPVPEQELTELLNQLNKDRKAATEGAKCRLTAVINAKGGAGATVLACNLAHLMAVEAKQKTFLLDLDLQFGVLPLYFDMHSQQSLLKVLDRVTEIDSTALGGLVAKHGSGLDLLGTMADQLTLASEIPVDLLAQFMNLLDQTYQQVVVDLPRQIDPLTGLILERADRILVVMQQSLTHIRAVKRLLSVLNDDLGISREQVSVVVNRYEANNKFRLSDIQETLGKIPIELVPNDFKNLENSVNLGAPLHDSSPHAKSTRSLADLALKLSGQTRNKPHRFGRVFASFF